MAQSDDDRHGAFTINDLWKPSIFTIDAEDPAIRPLHHFGLDSKDGFTFGDILTGAPLHVTHQTLDAFQYGALEEIPLPESVAATSELDSLELNDEHEMDDIWLYVADSPSDATEMVDRNWESFYDATFAEPARYLSDLGSAALDAVVAQARGPQSATASTVRIFQQQPALFALRALGIGCSSWLFDISDSHDAPQSRFQPMTISGLSPAMTKSIATSFEKTGTVCNNLRRYISQCYAARRPSSTKIAWAATVSTILDHVLFRMSDEGNRSQTILQTYNANQKPAQILDLAQKLAFLVEEQHSDVAILMRVFEFACQHEVSHFWARPLLLAVLDRVSRPWLDAMNRCLGLTLGSSCDRKLVAKIQSHAKDRAEGWDDTAARDVIPPFVTKNVADTILEVCNSITLLKEQNHDIGYLLKPASDLPLAWNFSGARRGADEKPTTLASMDPYGQSGTTIRTAFEAMAIRIESQPSVDDLDISDKLVEALEVSLSSDTDRTMGSFSCPLPLAPNLSFANTVEKQHRSIGRICLRMLFRDHNLREHLKIHHSFQLFGDGLFAARLSQALFSSEIAGIDDRRNYPQAGNQGLRLEDRNIWPPGGSELRLVLTGNLNESYYGTYSSVGGRMQELPGNFSFGIRQLSESEIQAIMDPHSLAALDFLRLQYTATSPLNTVFTEAALEKYEAIFKLLLRVLRLLAVTAQMAPRRGQLEPSISARFRIIATRFMEALSSYLLQGAISQPWSHFEKCMTALETSLDDEDNEHGGRISSVLELRAAHDAMLDAVLFGLLLRRRQAPVMELLEDIFGLILQFAQLRKLSGREQEISELYSAFCKKVRTFVTVCRGLSSKKSYLAGANKESMRHGEGTGIEQLVLRLDMNGWWTT